VLVKNQIGSNSLVANQQNIMNIVTNQMDVKEVKVRDEIGWIRGEFIFNRKSLDDIMKVLSRWYDMEVIFENDELRKVEFTGTVYKKQNLIEILNLIRNTNYIEGYKIDQSTTILY
jgi:ferric-dicitrate binding protein FerR (iron transport regulator)